MRWIAVGIALAAALILAFSPSHQRNAGRVTPFYPKAGDTTLWEVAHTVTARYGDAHPKTLVFVPRPAAGGANAFVVQAEGAFSVPAAAAAPGTGGADPSKAAPLPAVRLTFLVDEQTAQVSEIQAYDELGRTLLPGDGVTPPQG
ncbi:MAG TPA: hypothetical protein VFK80_11040 [Limnochordia bacterium]|nr:hypothetical protein [Limnochordia bacterium]